MGWSPLNLDPEKPRSGLEPTVAQIKSAAITCAENARGPAELRLMLAMLGITP